MKFLNNKSLIMAALVVFVALVGFSAISAANIDSGVVLDENNNFVMNVPYNSGTGYHWEVSSDSYGVELVNESYVVDHPDAAGSSGTAYFTFHVNDDEYCAKLILISPSGDVVDEVDSDMLN